MTQTANARPSKVTWDWVRIERGKLTRWRDVIPCEAVPFWLQLFDTLTAEKHDYRGVAITDRRWLRWLGCRDLKHLRSTFNRLSKACMVTLDGELVAAIPDVDAVWIDRAEMSLQKQKNSQGKGGQKGSGEPPTGCDTAADPSPPAADPATEQKGEEKQRPSTSAVGRPTPQPLPLPLPTASPSLLPRDQISGLVRSTTHAVQPETAKGLGIEGARAPPDYPTEPEPPTTPARASAALRKSDLANKRL